jgi:type IV secretory pathway TraG/TraD family ATPase VirD4
VRRLSEGEELIFVTGAKPLRAQKLRYDEEPVFRTRLLPAPEEARRRTLPSPWIGISSLGFAQRRAPDAPPGRDGAIVRALAQKAPLRSRPAPEQQQGDLLSALEANQPDQSSEADTAFAAQAALPAPSRFALRPPSEDSASEAGS